MKALNLDDLSKESRTITLDGVVHEVLDMSVENFIETQRKSDQLGENATDVEQIEAYVEMIARSVPSLGSPKLRSLSVDKLTRILKFLNGVYDEEAKVVIEAAADLEKKANKKGKA